jgi:hypothetical protein
MEFFMQKTNLLKLMIGITGACAFATAFAQEAAPTSSQTVDALLQAENKSVYERENPPRQTVRKNFDMTVQSIYGSESNMRADLMIGEKLQAGLSVGDKVGQYEIGLIEGRCVSLYPARSARERSRSALTQASLSGGEEFIKPKLKGKPTQLCWSVPVQATAPAAMSPATPMQGFYPNAPLPAALVVPPGTPR